MVPEALCPFPYSSPFSIFAHTTGTHIYLHRCCSQNGPSGSYPWCRSLFSDTTQQVFISLWKGLEALQSLEISGVILFLTINSYLSLFDKYVKYIGLMLSHTLSEMLLANNR